MWRKKGVRFAKESKVLSVPWKSSGNSEFDCDLLTTRLGAPVRRLALQVTIRATDSRPLF